MADCLLCSVPMRTLEDAIQDWEYGVVWQSSLETCPRCGLVAQAPRVKAAEIPDLYPDNYLAHTPVTGASSLYGNLKQLLARRTARQIAGNVPAGGVFLEIGCGNGHLLKTIASVRPDIRLVGVDIENVDISDLANFEFHHGQFEQVAVEPASIDLVYCSNLIEHVPDPVEFARKISLVLKPDGVVLGVTPDHLSLDRYLFGKYWAGYHYPRHTFIFNHHNIRQVLAVAGLSDINVSAIYSFWYLSFANRFMRLPGTRKRGFLFAVVTLLFLPFDLLVNLFRVHGSMNFRARKVAAIPGPGTQEPGTQASEI